MRIDSHQHFWRYDPEQHVWMGDAHGPIKRDFLPRDLKPLLESIEFDGSIAVQARQMIEETEWLLDLAGENPFIKGVVGWVDLRSEKAAEQIERFAANPLLKGVRHVVHDEPDDRFMMRSDFIRGISLLADFGLTYDLLLFPRHIPVAAELVEMFPDQPFVVDHIAKPLIKDAAVAPWDRDLRRLAEFPNVYCKLSGMVTEAAWRTWRYEDFVPYLDIVFRAFGPGRLMIGSDWPVCTLSGDYRSVMGIVLRYIEGMEPAEKEMILGGTCAEFYGV